MADQTRTIETRERQAVRASHARNSADVVGDLTRCWSAAVNVRDVADIPA